MEPIKTYYLDDINDQKTIKDFFLAQPDFRIIEIHGCFFIQFKTLKLDKAEFKSLDEVCFYEKLSDTYYFENEYGFESLDKANKSLTNYLNAPKSAKIHQINVTEQ